ncbi:MAG: TlpA family protein disulfide reductase [Mailhella sp.]|nr:TlpA family protein disulfide reductase [Mailhella sp.]
MKVRNASFFSRALRSMFCAVLAAAFMLPACAVNAEENASPSASGKLRAIQTYELLDMLAEEHGKVILVNFFASFCGPCRQEIPELIQLRKGISPDDLVIIGVAIDQDIRDAEEFVRKMGMKGSYPVFFAQEDLVRSYRINAIPFNVIYNRQGRIEVSEAGYVPADDMKKFIMDLIRR